MNATHVVCLLLGLGTLAVFAFDIWLKHRENAARYRWLQGLNEPQWQHTKTTETTYHDGRVAQEVERRSEDAGVGGSTPPPATQGDDAA